MGAYPWGAPREGVEVARVIEYSRVQCRCRCRCSEPSPGADVAGVSPVSVQRWQG